MGIRRLAPLLPAALPVFSIIHILVPYSIGVSHGELIPFLPTISHAGSCPSTATLFTSLTCLSAAIGFGCVLILHRLLSVRGESPWSRRLLLLLGFISTTATILVAFTPVGEHRGLHFIEVGFVIVGSYGCVVLLTALTPRTQPRMLRFRLGIVGIAIVIGISSLTTKLVEPRHYFDEMKKFDRSCNVSKAIDLGWRPGTWKLHSQICFALSEWTLIIMQGVFVASFACEIRERLGVATVLYTPLAAREVNECLITRSEDHKISSERYISTLETSEHSSHD